VKITKNDITEDTQRLQCPFTQGFSEGWKKDEVSKQFSLNWVSALCFLKCFNTACWVTEKTSKPQARSSAVDAFVSHNDKSDLQVHSKSLAFMQFDRPYMTSY